MTVGLDPVNGPTSRHTGRVTVAPPLPASRERLISPQFVIVTVSTLAFFTYIGVMVATIPRLIENALGGNEFDIGLNVAAFALLAIAIRPALGKFSERHGLRAMMLAGATLAMLATAAMVLINSRWLLLPIRGLQGVGEAAMFVGGTSLTTGVASASRRAEAASYFSVAVFGGIGFGPIIAEVVTQHGATRAAQFHTAMWVAVGCIAVSLVLTSRLAADRPASPPNRADQAGPLFHPAAIRPGFVLAFGIAGFSTFNAFVPKHADDVGLSGAGGVFAVYSIVCLLIRVVGARLPERIGLGRSASIALSALGTGLAMLGAWNSPVGVYASAAVVALGMSFMYPALQTMVVNAADDATRVRAIATFTMFFEVGSIAGGLVLGAVADATSKRGGFLGGAVVCVLGLVFLQRRVLGVRRVSERESVQQVD